MDREIEIVAKRSALDKSQSNSQKTISFLSVVNSALGSVNVNFDAETASECLGLEEYSKVYGLGASWSETIQASSANGKLELDSKLSTTGKVLKSYGRLLSANLVIGNAAYGLHPSYSHLELAGLKLASMSRKRLKLGAEGARYGKKAIDLAAKTGSLAYILHTPSAEKLMSYAKSRQVEFVVYTLLRLSESSDSLAGSELMRIKGMGYFERRGILRDNVSTSLEEFAIFGRKERVVERIRKLIDVSGASKIALYPVFESYNDLISQLKILSGCLG